MTTVVQVRRLDPTDRLLGEQHLQDEVQQIFAEPGEWMHQEHPLLGGRTPSECVDAGDEQLVWDLVRNIKYVAQT